MLDAADIAIEIVSPESVKRDYVTMFAEYEKGGVKEYWLIDPVSSTATFYCRDEADEFAEHKLSGSIYTTDLLPDLEIDVCEAVTAVAR